jgi:isocitrate/isopropylmalate dehydrogenase
MMLDFLGDTDAASRITKAVESYSADPSASTSNVGDAIAERV